MANTPSYATKDDIHRVELELRDLELRLTLRFGGMLVATTAILGGVIVFVK